MRTVRLAIEGRVQGVGYRAWTRDTAIRLGLAGWVRNRADGSVEALAQGAPDAVQSLIDACHDGPGLARVTRVRVSEADAGTVAGPGFEQRPTV